MRGCRSGPISFRFGPKRPCLVVNPFRFSSASPLPDRKRCNQPVPAPAGHPHRRHRRLDRRASHADLNVKEDSEKAPDFRVQGAGLDIGDAHPVRARSLHGGRLGIQAHAHQERKSRPRVSGGGFGLVPEAGIEPARLSARDFLPTSTFAAALLNAGRSWSGARLHHSLAAVGARRLLSTPSQAIARAWLGVGSVAEASRAFAEFDGLHFGRFPPKAQIVQVPCVYRFHHSGGVLTALKTPTSICWPLVGP